MEWQRFLNERLMPWIFLILSFQPIRGLDFWPSTNGKPLFQVLWFWLTSKIKLQYQQSDCNPPVLQSDCGDCSLILEIAAWLRRLQSDCWDCRNSATYIYMSQHSIWTQACCEVFYSDCRDCTLIVEKAVKLWILHTNYWDCKNLAILLHLKSCKLWSLS